MKFTDEVKSKDDDFSGIDQNDIFYTLLSGKDITEEIETTRGKFTVKFPKQKDLLLIDRQIAYMRGGVAAQSFDANANFNLEKVAYLNVCVLGGEKWFEKIKNNNNFSWGGDMPDSNFVDEIYLKAWTFRNKVQEKLKPNEKKADSGLSDKESVQSAVGDDLFSGVTSSN